MIPAEGVRPGADSQEPSDVPPVAGERTWTPRWNVMDGNDPESAVIVPREDWARVQVELSRLRAAEEEREDGDDLLYLAHVRHGELVAERDRLVEALERIEHGKPRRVAPGDEAHLEIPYEAATLRWFAREALASLEQKED